MRDEHGVIRDRNTEKVQWKKMVKTKIHIGAQQNGMTSHGKMNNN